MTDTILYFAYGSNLSSWRIHMNCPNATRRGIGKLKNYRLDFQRYTKRWQGCSATAVPHEGCHIWGAIWEISASDLLILDRVEGVIDNIYSRFEVDIELPDNTLKKCYIFQQIETPKEHFKLNELPVDRQPSRVYLNTITGGAEESGLPEEYQELLRIIRHNGFNNEIDVNLKY